MKVKILCSCVIVASSLLFSACKKSASVQYQPHNIIKTEKGVAIGAPDVMQMGAAGGVLTSKDGKVKITVPQGAVTTATQFKIQPISNKLYNDNASRLAYRLLPEGTTFAKPIQVEFKYDDDDLNSTVADLMTIAWQQADGSWKVVPTTLDKTNHTLKFETTHFSDWTKTGGFELKIEKPVLQTNEASKIWAVSITDEDLLAETGITPEDDAMLTALGNWKLIQGTGQLDETKGGSKGFAYFATYTAPTSVNGIMKVIITMEIEGFNRIKDPSAPGGIRNTGKMKLFARLVVSGNWMTGSFGGDQFGFLGDKVSAIAMSGLIVIKGSDGSGEVTLSANANGVGSYPCGQVVLPGKSGILVGSATGVWPTYAHSYFECGQAGDLKFSPSALQITKWPAVGGVAEGSFSGPVYLSNGVCGAQTKMLDVQFSAIRVN